MQVDGIVPGQIGEGFRKLLKPAVVRVASVARAGIDVRPERGPMSPIVALLERLRARYQELSDGEVATYIPELARVEPDRFAIAIATVDGAVYAVGDAEVRFTIQSMSKPLTYAAALEAAGETAVRRKIGVEPTGDAFNAITLSPNTGMPLNPMVNAGAIAATGIVPDRFERPVEFEFASELSDDPLFALYQRFAGRALTIDHSVYRSEGETGHRNRAIAYLELSSGRCFKHLPFETFLISSDFESGLFN